MTVYDEIKAARNAAHQKHGKDSIEGIPGHDPRWLSILVEEVGEVAHELTYDADGDLRAELVQVAAVASAWVDAIDRRKPRAFCHANHPRMCHHWWEDECSTACDRGEHDHVHGHVGCADATTGPSALERVIAHVDGFLDSLDDHIGREDFELALRTIREEATR